MNDDELPRPPYSAELLADLHAGAVDEAVAARLWPLVLADPGAVEFLARLDDTRARLAQLRDAPAAEPIPPEVAARLDAVLAAQGGAGVEGPSGRSARHGWFTAAGIGAAAAVAVVLVIVLRGTAFGEHMPDGAPLASEPPRAVGGELFEPGTLRAMIGRTDLGPLGSDDRLRECLAANGFDDGVRPLGAREVRYREQDAVLMLLSGPQPPSLTALVVGTQCSTDDPAELERRVIG